MSPNSVPFKNLRPKNFDEKYIKNRLNDEYPYKAICPDLGEVKRFDNHGDALMCFNDPNTGRCILSYNTEKYQYFIAYRFK